jgi:hypothetical protein
MTLWGVRNADAQTDSGKIADALRAAPDFITKDATILDAPSSFGGPSRVLRQGASEWTCLPGSPGPQHHEPACFDRAFFKFIKESLAGQTPHLAEVGVAYMYMGEFIPNQAGKAVTANPEYHVGPHVMILFPHQEDLEALDHDGSNGMPYVNHLPGHTELFLVVPVQHFDQSPTVTGMSSKASK